MCHTKKSNLLLESQMDNTSLSFASSQNPASITHNKSLSRSLLMSPLVIWICHHASLYSSLPWVVVPELTRSFTGTHTVSLTHILGYISYYIVRTFKSGTFLVCDSSSQNSSEYMVRERPDLGTCKLFLINASSMYMMSKTIVFYRNKWTNAYAYIGLYYEKCVVRQCHHDMNSDTK